MSSGPPPPRNYSSHNFSFGKDQGAKKTKPAPDPPKWPQSLHDYAEKAFAACRTEGEKNKMQSRLTEIIQEAIMQGILHSRRWEYESIPTVNDHSNSESVLQQQQPANKPSTTKQDRAKRFKMEYDKHIEGKRLAEKVQPLEEDSAFSLEGEVVVGTCEKLEKPYLRLTSAPEPHTVRPLRILKKTFALLQQRTKEGAEYTGYLCDQFKSLRQDLTVQRIQNEFTIHVYEENARICLVNADLGEYNQCQTQLRSLYALGIKGGAEDEFLAYRILYFLHTKNTSALNLLLKELHKNQMHKFPAVAHALQVRAALASKNYPLLLGKLYQNAPNMGIHLMKQFVGRERIAACKSICLAFRPTLSLQVCAVLLGFDSCEECKQFLEQNEAQFIEQLLDTKASLEAFSRRVEQCKVIDIKGQI